MINSIRKTATIQLHVKFSKPNSLVSVADDVTVITGLEKENQLLLNQFTRWCNWAGMKISVNKYVAFWNKEICHILSPVPTKAYFEQLIGSYCCE